MNKTVPLYGMSTSPSDYSSRDGDCSIMHNAIVRDGEVRPMHEPVLRYTSEYRVLFVHKMTKVTNVICYDSQEKKLKYADAKGLTAITEANTNDVCSMKTLPTSVKSVGNILICDTEEGTVYIRFDGTKYVFLGNGLPELPKIAFSLASYYAESSYQDPVTGEVYGEDIDFPELIKTKHNIEDGVKYCSDIADTSVSFRKYTYGEDTRIGFNSTADKTLAREVLYSKIIEMMGRITEHNAFCQPFLVRYAYKLYDGSIQKISPAVLVKPTTGLPFNIQVNTNNSTLVFDITAISSFLFHSVIESADLSLWGEIISSVCVFVSNPIYTFQQDYSNVDIDTFFISEKERISKEDGGFSGTAIGAKFKPLNDDGSLDYDQFEEWNIDDETSYYDTHFQENKYRVNINPKDREDTEKAISNIGSFYLCAELDVDDIKPSYGTFVHTNLKEGVLKTLTTGAKVLEEDYLSNYDVITTKSIVYNNRLVKTGEERSLKTNFTLDTLVQYAYKGSPFGAPHCYVKLKRGDGTYTVDLGNAKLPLDHKASWLFYPDPNATELIFVPSTLTSGTGYWSAPLKRHDILQGAYWTPEEGNFNFEPGDFVVNSREHDFTEGDTTEAIPVTGMVYMSEINNPFIFPSRYATNVGTGDVLALATATKALSEGQFGQFPIYAFTTEGIWAIEINDEGKMIARSPITRDVCTNPDAIISIDDAIIYPSLRDVMMISGSETKSLTSNLRDRIPYLAPMPFLPLLAKKEQITGKDLTKGYLPEGVKIAEYANAVGTTSGYNPQMGQIFLSNPKFLYSFVLDVESGFWSTTDNEGFVGYVNDYPVTLLTKSDNSVYDLSVCDFTKSKPSILITRPISFGDPDTYKSVRDMHVRGNFARGTLMTALYGSQDCKAWNIISSSDTEFIHLRAGSGYKYIAVAAFPGNRMKEGDSIACIDFDITPKYTNKLR